MLMILYIIPNCVHIGGQEAGNGVGGLGDAGAALDRGAGRRDAARQRGEHREGIKVNARRRGRRRRGRFVAVAAAGAATGGGDTCRGDTVGGGGGGGVPRRGPRGARTPSGWPTRSSATRGATRWSPNWSTPPSNRADVEELIVTNADNDVSTMNSQISDMVASGVDILLVNAVSETASNAELERAHDAGVVVVSFDATVDTPAVDPRQHRPRRVRHRRGRVAGRGHGRQRLGRRPQRDRRQPGERGPLGRRPGGVRRRRDRGRRPGQRRLGPGPGPHRGRRPARRPPRRHRHLLPGRGDVGRRPAGARSGRPRPAAGARARATTSSSRCGPSSTRSRAGRRSPPPTAPSSWCGRSRPASRSSMGEDPGQEVIIPLPVITQETLADYVRTRPAGLAVAADRPARRRDPGPVRLTSRSA